MYRLVIVPPSTEPTGVFKNEKLFIPLVPANADYQEYLDWLAEGNEPLPADEPAQ